MKGLFFILALFVLLLSCKESGVPLSKPSTFVRYFSDGNPNDAVDVLETSDNGFLIMSYSKPSGSNTGWINLIKTSINGNTIWEKSIKSNNALSDLKPSNIVAINDNSNDTGYLIVGTNQNPGFGSRLFIARTDNSGTLKDSISYAYHTGSGLYLKGRGVAQNNKHPRKDFFVIAQVVLSDQVTPATNEMLLARIKGTTLDTIFTHSIAGYTTDLVNRLTLSLDTTKVFWGGTRVDGAGSHLLLVRSKFDSEPKAPDWGEYYPKRGLSFVYNYLEDDINPYGDSYHGIIGTHFNPALGKYDSIIFVKANSSASKNPEALAVKEFALKYPTSQRGGSVCTTSFGFLLLYTEAVDAGGTNTDYAIAKLDYDGNPTKDWPVAKTFGGKYLDIGKRVLQSSDGGYVVLGTTVLANVETVFFMKTDGGGNIQ